MKRKLFILLLIIFAVLFHINIALSDPSFRQAAVRLSVSVIAEQPGDYKLYYSDSMQFSEEQSVWCDYTEVGEQQKLTFTFPTDAVYLRFDFPETGNDLRLSDVFLQSQKEKTAISEQAVLEVNNVEYTKKQAEWLIRTAAEDPYLLIDVSDMGFQAYGERLYRIKTILYKLFLCLILDGLIILMILRARTFGIYFYEIYENRKLIWKLSRNDFKTKYAGSYLGIIWAFIQPIVTILVYWFVFQFGLRNGNVGDTPYALWLMAGLIPWFFFSESLNGATSAMIEYSYLVKKVVFRIHILPLIKMLSAFFVHVCFVIFLLLVYALNRYTPDQYTLQIVYYSICMFCFVWGFSYLTSAIVVFVKDLTQIISIVLQIGVWMTPIMWNIEMLPQGIRWLFKLNPMFYVVEGYRDALINKRWFWENIEYTLYFWLLTAAVFYIGIRIFRKLRGHFADLL